LLLRHRCLPDDLNLRWAQRLSVVAAVLSLLAVLAGGVMALVLWQAPPDWLSLAVVAGVASVIWLNRDFYAFLLMRWGLANTLAAMAFHFVYHLSSATGAAVGLTRYAIATRRRERPPVLRRAEAPIVSSPSYNVQA
jgi:hypothetical protein